MPSNRNKRIISATLVLVFVAMVVSPVLIVDAIDVPSDINIGPYVDKVVFKIIGDRFLSLLAGEIDLIDGFFSPEEYEKLDEDPDISFFTPLRNGYGHLGVA